MQFYNPSLTLKQLPWRNKLYAADYSRNKKALLLLHNQALRLVYLSFQNMAAEKNALSSFG